jgi:hypothetical protein
MIEAAIINIQVVTINGRRYAANLGSPTRLLKINAKPAVRYTEASSGSFFLNSYTPKPKNIKPNKYWRKRESINEMRGYFAIQVKM